MGGQGLTSKINIYLQNCESYPDENDQEFIDELQIAENAEKLKEGSKKDE